MTKIKTSELQGAALDWAVAEATGEQWSHHSTDWRQGGRLVEYFKVGLAPDAGGVWWAVVFAGGVATSHERGPTPLIAACRAIVAAKLGDEADVLEGLV